MTTQLELPKMAERPILFSGEMVRAILDGRKSQTRRIVKPQPTNLSGPDYDGLWSDTIDPVTRYFACPFGVAGDRLWVRETWALHPDEHPDEAGILYRATDPGWDDSGSGLKWKPSIFMPRWASRIMLEITSVRVERLNDISDADAIAEGVVTESFFVDQYQSLWKSINGPRSWDANPWVWVIGFKRVNV